MNNIKENLIKHKINLPEATKPIANYSPYLIVNNLVFIFRYPKILTSCILIFLVIIIAMFVIIKCNFS